MLLSHQSHNRCFTVDSMIFEVTLDHLEARLSTVEKQLTKALNKLAILEEHQLSDQLQSFSSHQKSCIQPVSSVSSDSSFKLNECYTPSQSIHLFTDDDDDDIPPLPPPTQSHLPVATNCLTPSPFIQQSHWNPSHYPFQQFSEPSTIPSVNGHSRGESQSASLKPTKLYNSVNTPNSNEPCRLENLSPPFNKNQQSTPSCFPVERKVKRKEQKPSLPSIHIDKENLAPYETVMKKYSSLQKENVIGKLAVKLAKESFFGTDVMKRCTVMGCTKFPALPVTELNGLKQAMFSLYPAYWNNPVEFESKIWNPCAISIGQACKRLRSEAAVVIP